jgi:hypothetical protein
MTIAEDKLEDAQIQLDLALKNIDDEKTVRSCVNAFFAHARSVDEVLEKDSTHPAALKTWTESRLLILRALAIYQFVRKSRNHSIHRGTLPLQGVKALRNLNQVTPEGHRILGSPFTTIWVLDGAEASGLQPYVVPFCREYLDLLRQFLVEWSAERARLGL